MKLNFQWKENRGLFQSGESLYLNAIRVGSYDWNGSRSKGNEETKDDNYVGDIFLPSLKVKRVVGIDRDTVKDKIEKAITSWFSMALEGKK